MSFMIAEALRNCRHLLVFSGAGVSAESGIPTFRDALTGLWARFDPARLATPEAFLADPELVGVGTSGVASGCCGPSRMRRTGRLPS